MLFRLGLCSLPPFPLLLPAKTGSEDEYFPNYVDVALQAGLTARTVIAGHESKDFLLSTTGGGIALFDYDNDGWLDIFIVNSWGLSRFPKGEEPTNHLYRNNRDGTFTDVTAKANLVRSGWGQGVCVGDYNNDGLMDLFVTYYGKSVLYRNNGDGSFTDVSRAAGIAKPERTYGFTPCVADYDNDGWLDIYVANDSTPSLLFKNNRNGTFTEIGLLAGVAVDENGSSQGGMGVDAGDYDGDGLLDIKKTKLSDQTTSMYNNHGNGIFTDRTFQAGLSGQTSSVKWGTSFFDFDNDGQLDLLMVAGAIYPPRLSGSRAKPKEDEGKKILYHNLGNGRF